MEVNKPEKSVREYIDILSSSAPVPGGGNAAAVVNAMGCALMLMSLRIAVLKKDPSCDWAGKIEEDLLRLQNKSLELAEKDSLIFSDVMKKWKTGGELLEKALFESYCISKEIAAAALELIGIIQRQDLQLFSNIITDVGAALSFAEAAAKTGLMNCAINSKAIPGKCSETGTDEMKQELESCAAVVKIRIEKTILES